MIENGGAGATVFAWTDEWAVADVNVDHWGFGVTTADRQPKPAFEALKRWAHTASTRGLRQEWPKVTVVICAYNEERMIAGCLDSVLACDYPGLEVIVCDDGSRDRTREIASTYPFKLLALPHGGLSAARNAGIEAATGEYVAFLDADARCHPEWPYHLVLSMAQPGVAATGGPNPPVESAGFVERAVALSPGGPIEVLLSDDRAEHVPGCNMAFRRDVLRQLGGFLPAYTSAGDDVDLCWRLLDAGHHIAFAPVAQVRHHRRSTIKGYLRQQIGYGRSERMLSGPHAHRFNRLGQARWAGVVYGGARLLPWLFRSVIYHGWMGMAPFQKVERRFAEAANGWFAALLPLSLPLAVAGLALAFVSSLWLCLSAAMVLVWGGYFLNVALTIQPGHREPRPLAMRTLVALLHVLQPFARMWGRLRGRPLRVPTGPEPQWSGQRADWVAGLRRNLEAQRCKVRPATVHQPWDIVAECGVFWRARIVTGVAWGWEPRQRVAYRLLPAPIAPCVAVAALSWGTAAAVACAVLLLLVAYDGLLLRQRVQRALDETTAGADA